MARCWRQLCRLPQPAPPAAALSDLPLIPRYSPRRSPTSGRARGSRGSAAAPLPPGGRQPLEKREQKGSLGHAQALTSSCKFPLPAACGCTPGSSLFLLRRALCLGVRIPPTALPASHSLARLAHRLSHTYTHPKLHVRGTRGNAKDEAITPPRDFPRVKGGHATISHHFCKFPFLPKVCRCRGRHRWRLLAPSRGVGCWN